MKERFPSGPVAVVFGSSRGIGGATAESLGKAKINILGIHAHLSSIKRQDKVEENIRQAGGHIQTVLGDITKRSGQQAILNAASDYAPSGVDYLILNVAGGLEPDKKDDQDWPEKINVAAQMEAFNNFLPRINKGGSVIWVTSNWAYRYGQLKQIEGYEDRVALPKKITEQLLINKIPLLQDKGISLGIISGHLITDTGFYPIAKRYYSDTLDQLKSTVEGVKEGQDFPSATDMGEAIRDMVLGGFKMGEVRFVGGPNGLPYDEDTPPPFVLNRRQITDQLLPMYGDDKLLLDIFVARKNRMSGQSRLDVELKPTEGHFKDEYGKGIRFYRGVDQAEHHAQTIGAILRSINPSLTIVPSEIPLFRKTTSTWDGVVLPGDQIITEGLITSLERNRVSGICESFIRGVGIVSRSELSFDIAHLSVVQRMIKTQLALREKYWE